MINNKKTLNFRFTKNLFQIDVPGYENEFNNDPIETLYNCTAEEKKGYDHAGKYLYRIVELFFETLSKESGLEYYRDKIHIPINSIILDGLLDNIPFVPGSEFVNKEWICNIWDLLESQYKKEISQYKGSVQLYLAERSQRIRIPERIFFHLVEYNDNKYPFAFLATYSTEKNNEIKHVPLEYALTEYKDDQGKIINLLSCLHKVENISPVIRSLMDNGELFYPCGFSEEEAYEFLKSIPAIEETGIVCRIPDWWKNKTRNLKVSFKVGKNNEGFFGIESILDIQANIIINGEPLSINEAKALLNKTEGLALIKGKWVEVDHKKLEYLLKIIEENDGHIRFKDVLRCGLVNKQEEDVEYNIESFLNKILGFNRKSNCAISLPSSFTATLRPYQQKGFEWLYQLYLLGFGSCIADDMGLGKTIQVLALLETIRIKHPDSKMLLVVPASLIGNWEKECLKFTPELPFKIIHNSKKRTDMDEGFAFLNITTYGQAKKPEIQEYFWTCVILDEAQAIKNTTTQQTKYIKSLKTINRIAITGTPIENDLSNLWSIFDFLNKGLLGSKDEFESFCNSIDDNENGYSKLKRIISPFLLRRLKTDKTIINDLPDKIEIIDYISLSPKQSVLYRNIVSKLASELKENTEGIERKGILLSYLIKLKQICNHPSQYIGIEEYTPKDSGKFEYLGEICKTIYEKRERVLIFTQFKEIIEPLNSYLNTIFMRPGLVIHGGVNVKARTEIVNRFQSEEYIPYMILSLKAGGTGLTLTNANHVIHFDRWWNPAVENQATDRAFRIGQNKNVIVHKFVTKGTLEEKIHELVESKKMLSENVIGSSSNEIRITEMSDQEILNLMKLEI